MLQRLKLRSGDAVKYLLDTYSVRLITSATRSRWALAKPCLARLKLFTLDNQLVIRKAGKLHAEHRRAVLAALRRALPPLR